MQERNRETGVELHGTVYELDHNFATLIERDRDMPTSNLLLESGLRRFTTKRTYEGQCIVIDRVTADDGEPERFTISRNPGHELMLFNQRGSLLMRRSDDAGWEVIPAGCIALVNSSSRIEGVLTRGAHSTFWVQWTHDCAKLLTEWLEEKRLIGKAQEATAIVRANAPENRTIASEMTPLVAGTAQMIEPRLQAGLQLLAVSALMSPKSMVLTPVPGDLATGLTNLVDAVHADPIKDWSLKQAAQVAGYSQFHLSRTFRVELGYGLPEFVERCRVEMALKQIHSGNRDLNDIAMACGFSTPSAFREALKKIVGVLPSELRRFSQI